MTICVYDNPQTMAREAWQNGQLIASISAKIMAEKGATAHRCTFFGLNIGPWNHGLIIGDAQAIKREAVTYPSASPPLTAKGER